jgi:hypothetical protein
MAYTPAGLNNIAGSTGYANIWVYTEDAAVATLDADNYFAGAQDYGVKAYDIVFLVGSDGVLFGCFDADPTATTSSLAPITDLT